MNHESDHTVEAARKVINAGLLELLERCNYLYHEAFYANTELASSSGLMGIIQFASRCF